MQKRTAQKGFSLMELLVVIAILTILSVIVFIALNPVGRFSDARNSRRFNDINNVLTAVHECIVDNDGAVETCVGSFVLGETYEVVNTGVAVGCDDVCTGVTSDSHCMALDSTLASYLKSLPVDPGGATTDHTEYSISIDSNNLVTVAACSAESGELIEVSR